MQIRILVMVACVLLLARAGAADPAKTGKTSLREDERLERKVTVSRPRIYLGEALQELSRQSRVALKVEDTKGAVSGIDLTMFLKERPVRQVMESLQELLSHRFDRWEWQSNGKEPLAYVLRHQRSPESASAAAREEILRRWTADVKTYYEIARLPKDQRGLKAASRRDLFPPGLAESGQPALLAKLEPRELETLLRDGFIPMDLTRLTKEDHEALKFGESGGLPTRRPEVPAFYIRWERGHLAPVLWGRGSNGEGANIVGGMVRWDGPWLRSQDDGWTTRASPDAETYRQQLSAKALNIGGPAPIKTLYEWLKYTAEKQQIELIADLVSPRHNKSLGSAWLGRTPEQTLLALVLRGDLAHKPSGEIHLLRDPRLFVNPRQHLVSWPQIRSLRVGAERGEGYLGLSELLQISELSNEQRTGLVEEFPVVDGGPFTAWRPILEFYGQLLPRWQERARSPAGIPFGESGLVARAFLLEGPDPGNYRGQQLLREHLREAVVSLRIEPFVIPGAPAKERIRKDTKLLVWEVRVPGLEPLRRQLVLQPRTPLLPKAE